MCTFYHKHYHFISFHCPPLILHFLHFISVSFLVFAVEKNFPYISKLHIGLTSVNFIYMCVYVYDKFCPIHVIILSYRSPYLS
jgi:hypothetical protein